MCPGFHNTDVNSNRKITFGIILILAGLLFLLNTIGVISFKIAHVVFSFPFFLLVVGILILVNSSKRVLGGILSGLGIFFLLPRIFPDIDYGPNLVLPVLLISLGIYVIFKHTQKKSDKYKNNLEANIDLLEENKYMIEDIAIFGGGNKVIHSDNFKGGSIIAIFGGSEIDLSNCKLAEGNNVIEIVCIFGGTTIIVPKEWNIQLNVTPLFGGFSNKAYKIPNLEIDKSRTLIIKGVAIFGGGEIKSIYS